MLVYGCGSVRKLHMLVEVAEEVVVVVVEAVVMVGGGGGTYCTFGHMGQFISGSFGVCLPLLACEERPRVRRVKSFSMMSMERVDFGLIL